MAKGSGANMGVASLLIVVGLLAMISSILIPIFIPFIRTAGTTVMATVTTASVNTTITTFIGLLDYVVLFWYIGVILGVLVAALGTVIFAVNRIRG